MVLADDHAVVRAGLANALRELPNIEIVGEVGEGNALFTMLAQTRPDFLLTDVTMPNFEPISTISQIRAHYPGMKILVVSAYDDDIYVQGLLGAGVDGYHLKDQPLSDLRLAVQRIIAGERWVCSPLVAKLLHRHDPVAPGTRLTARQRDLLRCLREGLDNQAIARRTGLSVKTIENHLTRLYRQLDVQSRLEAASYIAQHPELLGVADATMSISAVATRHPVILIVDDNMRYRDQMRRTISKSYPHALIYEAENTRVALQHIERSRPQLAFVDVVLGDENGIECARRIHAQASGTRIILISAYPDREFHRLGLNVGAIAFLDKKDLDAAALCGVIDDLAA